MRLIAWNIRAGGGKRIKEIAAQLNRWEPDIVTLSEFRGTPPSQDLAKLLAAAGLSHQLNTTDPEKRATNALLLASRWPLQVLKLDFPDHLSKRWLLAQVDLEPTLFIGSMHVPNYVSGQKRIFQEAVLSLAKNWSHGPGVFLGDTNSGLPSLDEETKFMGPKEWAWLKALDEVGWVDVFRYLKGEERVYTWYSPNGNNGFRLDQAFLNQDLLPATLDMKYAWGQPLGETERRDSLSDHAALILDLA